MQRFRNTLYFIDRKLFLQNILSFRNTAQIENSVEISLELVKLI